MLSDKIHILLPIFWFVVSIAFNVFLLLYDKYFDIPIDIELSHISTILMTMSFGLGWGIATAIFTKLAVMINNVDFSLLSPLSISCYILASILTTILRPYFTNITIMVVIIVLVSNIISYLIMRYIYNLSIYSYTYSLSNIIFNLIVISILHV